MNLTKFLENLSAKNVELRMDGDKLRCRAPENVLTPELLDQIKQYKQEIIRILANDGAENPSTYPLSHGQEALWFLYQLAPSSTAYNTTYAARLVTNLDIPALKQATQVLIERHPVLRTTFTTLDGEPVQTVHQNQQVDFSIIEASDLGQEDLKNWLKETSDRPFDLEQGPILRFQMLINHTTNNTLATLEHILLITTHHIVVDFWSLEIIVSELRVLYEAITTDVEPLLPQQNCQYRDYVKWSKQMLASNEGDRLSTYWRQQLSGELPVLSMPTDRPRPKFQTYNGADCFFSLEEKLLQKLKELANREGVSLYTILLTALQILLLRYTNQKDILIGSPMVNRSRLEFEQIVGYFTNPVVLRADMSGNPTFQELLGRSRRCVLEALDHQDYPFPLLVEEMQPVRDPSYSPLCQVMFAWDRSHQSEGKVSIMDSDGLIVESMIPGVQGAAFDLTLTILDVPGALKGTWNYNTDLFDSSTIERMTGHFLTLLSAIVANPVEHIGQLPLLTELEQQQLLVEWNQTQTDYPSNECIHSLFEAQVKRTPDAVAVVYENQQLTYSELNARANQLAHYLRSLGVRADVLVGICVERSVEMVVGLLGILKAGGAYVPLDPEYPTERLSFMLLDTQLQVLLTQEKLVESFPQHQARVVCLDTDWQSRSKANQDNVNSTVSVENLSYVIYTSGSTGTPKGVAVTHRAVNRLVLNTNYIQLTSDDRVAQAANIAFDAATFEIWGALLTGAKLIIITQSVLLIPKEFAVNIRNHEVSVLFLTTALFNQLASFVPSAFRFLRYLLFGGEAVDPSWVKEVLDKGAPQHLLHVYGPTENTTFSSSYLLLDLPTLATTIPIGGPIANTQIYLLDQNLQPVPIGIPGELYLGGAGLARGYLNRAELTAEKFIPNPLGPNADSRLYKTGDEARYLSDGNIEYLGRLDNQVKIRGFRIELGEIEATLSQHADINSVVVIAREDNPGNKRLVAYVVPSHNVTPTISVLRQFLLAKLPDYMVPSAIVILEALPLTPNGKVDRRALPTPELFGERTEQFVAPRTPMEEILAHNWAQVLKLQLVGIHDNFFSLGGHSLLATQLISRIRTHLQVELPLRSLFAAPTVADLAPVIIQLQQQDLGLSTPPILPRDSNAEVPLSKAQTRLWFLDQYEPNSALYNIPGAWRLVGTLDVNALEQSLTEIIARHSALRTNFISVSGEPVQMIHPAMSWSLAVVDYEDLPTHQVKIATEQWLSHQAREPFDLATGALVRATLLVLSPTEHLMLVCMHHIISDGWSMGVFVQELAVLYNAYSTGQPSPLAPLPIEYADFAKWQRHWLTGNILQTQLAYWQKQLNGAPALLSLPTDRPRPRVQTFTGAHQEFTVPVELTEKLTQLSQQLGATLFMTLLAGFDILLYRYTGVSDIIVGTPIANRNHSQIEGLIGFFVNTIVLRTDLADNPTFSELVERVRSMALSAYAHQDLPFEMLVEALQPERDLSYTPLFQVMFVLQNAPNSTVELTGLSVSPLSIESPSAKFDLTLSMQNTETGLVGVWEYNTDLFDANTIERMSGHFLTLLSAIVANPAEHIGQLPLLTASEQQQLLVEWNDTQADYPLESSIPELFEVQVERTPDAVAVVYENQQLTYNELNCRANQLAHYLRSVGVRADVLVGICVERSIEMVVAILGILKAGGAYVPLDPEYPTERLSLMLEDARVSVLLTQQHLVQRLGQCGAQVVCWDEMCLQISQNNQDNPVSGVKADNLAYVIYTSGSTGIPKGVMVRHRGLCNLAPAQMKKFGVQNSSRILQFASLSFDASISEIIMALVSGATLYLGTKDSLLPGVSLIERLRDNSITHVTLPPSVLAVLAVDELPALQTMIVAGEATSAELIKQWSSGRNFFNAYGPTEATVCATIAKYTDGDLKISIGRPLANTQIYILDQYLQPVPVGVPGELHIGGAGLARGYLNRRELTQQKFIPNPFSTNADSRLYKTGDEARYLSDGNIEYLGRLDNQVKIRGFRIELGEIEATLSQHADINSVVVIAREDTPGDKRLVAYVVPSHNVTPTISSLRQFLLAKLPDYMVPSAIVILEALPLTPNGKVDRRALPTPELFGVVTEEFVAPRTPMEELLAHNWAQVLKLKLVGIHDNFFSLGGHSLLATQLISRIRTHLQVELPLRSLFAAPTVADLAPVILQLQQQDLRLSTPPILPRASNAEVPLSKAQTRLWFLDQYEPNSALYNIPGAWRLVGTLDVSALEQSLTEIIARHSALRTNFISVSGQPVQMIHPAMSWTLAVVDYEDLPTYQVKIATKQSLSHQARETFDLATGALVRATLLVLSPTEHLMLVCMHHIISDGWSMGVFFSELAALYNAYSTRQPSPLAPLPIEYADFAIWQRHWLTGDLLQTQLAYWQKQLNGAPALLSLPTDRPRPRVQTFTGAHQEFTLSVELTEKLTQLSQQLGATLFMTLLASFDTLLYRYTGVSDIIVGTPIANRNHPEIEGLIGFFVNTIVLRTDLADNPTFSELVERVRSMALSAYAHQDLPFEMLVEALQPERDISYTPLFQVMFVLQNAPNSTVELTGLSVNPLSIESPSAKFDLTLSMQNTETGLVGVWEYNTDLFDFSTIERMSGHFLTLLEAIVANPVEHIAQLPLLTADELIQLLVEWNQTQTEYTSNECIHSLFEAQVKRTPDAVALVYENQQLTYSELNNRANQLAHYLRSVGVRADVLVGICVERSVEMVVGILGILKAGGAYVPLDPEYPTERLSFMLLDTSVSVLLTQQQLVESLPQHQARIVCLDTDWLWKSESSQDNLLTDVQATNLAYVIYTSGSTGQPKGVMLSHSNLCNHMFWMQATFPLTEQDKVLQKTPFGFDASVWEFYAPLFLGGQLVMAQPRGHTDSAYLLRLIAQQKVTTVQLVPSLLQMLLEQGGIETCHCLKHVFCGGEVLPVVLVEGLLSKLDVNLHNLYGPTEACIDTTSWNCKPEMSGQIVPIGRPIANTQIYILDQYLQPVPVGVPGELHIGGAGLARGYLNRPELTQEKFIPNPFSTNADSRLYKTGDEARYLSDGNIEYLGRLDNQVKIRGFRIELGEIEAALREHDHLQASVVIARVDNPGNKRLVAYIVPPPDQTPTMTELRQFLKSKLPDYMVPSAIVILEALPLTPNGKIDRLALPSPESRGGIEVSIVLPRTPIEEILAIIWASVLRVPLVGIHDNFFELGGDSILSIQIITRAKLAGVQLTIKQLFAHQTIAELATVAGTSRSLQISHEQGLVTGTFPLTPIQHWFFEQNLPQPHHFNQSFLLSVPSNFQPGLLEPVWQQLLLHHDALRLRFTQSQSGWQQIHSAPSDDIAFSLIDLSTLPETEHKSAIVATATSLQASLNLEENLVIVAFFRLGVDKRARLLLVIHHLVVDGVSWRILLEDLLTAYEQLESGKAIQLPAKTTSFKDWGQHLTEYAHSSVFTKEMAYWLRGSRATVASIPVDHTIGANTVATANTVSVSLNEAQTHSLLQDVPKAYKTQINDVLLTALVLVLSRWTNSHSVLFNLEGHGREDIIEGVDLSRTVGWFTTIFPVQVELSTTDKQHLGNALKSVKEQLRAIPHKGIGYGLLRYLSLDTEIAAQLQTLPLAEISFNYLGQFTQVLNTTSLMQLATESSGESHSWQNQRSHLLDINAIITNEQLQIDWTYSTNVHQQSTIEKIALEFVATLRSLITHCLSPENGGYTPTDFPLVKLDQLQLDQVLASLEFKPELSKTLTTSVEDIYPLSPMQ